MRSCEGSEPQYDCKLILEKMLDSFDEVLFVNEKLNKVFEVKNNGRFDLLHGSDDAVRTLNKFKKEIYPEDLGKFEEFNLYNGKKIRAEIRCRNIEGKYRWCYFELVPVNEFSYLALFLDLTSCFNDGMKMKSEILDREEEIKYHSQITEQKFNTVIEHADIMVFEYEIKSQRFHFYSNLQNSFLFSDNFDYSADRFFETDFIYKDDKAAFRLIFSNVRSNDRYNVKIRFKDNSGDYFWCSVYSSAIYDAGGNLCAVVGTVKDAENSLRKGELLYSDEGKDGLTGLLSSKEFCSEMRNILLENPDSKYAMIMFDIEKFKYINELYGVEMADEIIQFIAFNMKKIFSAKDQITARFTRDYFGVLTYYNNDDEIIRLIEDINSKISVYKHVNIQIAYGIFRITDTSIQPRLICDYANIAKSTIKGSHIRNYAFYSEVMKNKILEDRKIENEMEPALVNGQFVMYLQPKYNIRTSDIIGAEALVRWIHPQKGIIMPDKFIPLFERNGFVTRLDEYIWEQACSTIRKWLDSGRKVVPISVNVSRINIGNPDLVDILDGLVEKYDIEKRYLELEITETVYYDDQKNLAETLMKLKSSGYTLLMDDFGSGFSSLNMLKNTPFDILKIDRNFLNETMITDKGKKIILYTIGLSNDIGMHTVAEGVETKEQADYLLKCGCNVAQGYYYSKPVTVDAFENMFSYSAVNM